MARSSRRRRRKGAALDTSEIEAEVAAGGLALFEPDGTLFQLTPPDVANSLRFLVARLQRDDDIDVDRTIAITSAIEGEGVTTTARGLAGLIAHDLDRSVCLVETNWWRDTGPVLATPRRQGLADVLQGRCSLEQALMPTSDERLRVLPSGELPLSTRAALASGSDFTETIELLGKLHDAVVIDAPPLLKVSEATTIVRRADCAALVVRHGITTELQVQTAVEELTGTELLGVIMNQWSTSVPRVLRRYTVPT